jgi:hypothetical protein
MVKLCVLCHFILFFILFFHNFSFESRVSFLCFRCTVSWISQPFLMLGCSNLKLEVLRGVATVSSFPILRFCPWSNLISCFVTKFCNALRIKWNKTSYMRKSKNLKRWDSSYWSQLQFSSNPTSLSCQVTK